MRFEMDRRGDRRGRGKEEGHEGEAAGGWTLKEVGEDWIEDRG